MRILIKGLTGILLMALILPCIKPVEAQEQLADVTLEQALSAPPQHLAKGYLVVKAMIPLARLAQQGATIQRSLNDADDVINSANADDELRSLENRLSIYEQAIRRRGFTQLGRAYLANADKPCEKIGVGSVATLCEQSGFEITIAQGHLIHHGVVVESVVMVEHSANSEIHLIGKATAGQIIFDASIVGFSAMMYPVECNVVLKEADRNDKSFSPAYLGRARGQLRRNEIQKALDDLAEAIRVDPEFAPAYAIRSQIFSKENDARFRNGKRAVDDATTACELTKWENWEYLVPLAAAYAENGEFQLAIQWVNKTIKSAPASEREQLQEELEQYRQNKPSRFEIDPTDDVLDPNSSDSPLDASGWFDRGKAKFDAQKYRECIADFTEALNLDPTIPSAYVHRGTARRMIDEAEKAIADYGEAIRIDPTYAAAFIGRAHVLRTKGDYANAIEDYAETIRLQPDNASAFRYRAVALQEIGEADQAIEDWSQAILLHPKNSWSYRRRGFLWHARGDYQQAINDFEVAIDLDSESAWAHNQLAWLLASCPDRKYRDGLRAIELATKACTLSEWKDTHIDTLAAAYAESGDFDEAIRWQEKAIELAPAASKDDYRSRLKLYKSGEPYYAE